jgi:bacterioferritin-associated ferredoxin
MAKDNNKLNMGSIQEIHALEQHIYDIVQDFVDDNYNVDDVLAIGKRCGKITMKADAKAAIKVGKSTELYPLKGQTT